MQLRIVEFSRNDLTRVKDIDCGTEDWAVWAARWIKEAPPFPSALQSMQKYGTKVWLYFVLVDELDEEFLVGFASLGKTKQRVPAPSDAKRAVGLVPMFAVATMFQGKAIPGGKKYSHLIIEDVIHKAQERGFTDLCLTVHPRNKRAITLYERFGFRIIGDPDARGNLRMHKSLG